MFLITKIYPSNVGGCTITYYLLVNLYQALATQDSDCNTLKDHSATL